MKPHIAITVLKIFTKIAFYLLLIFTLLFCTLSVLNILGLKGNLVNNMQQHLTFPVQSFGTSIKNKPTTHKSQTASYQQLSDQFIYQVAPNSPAGYYAIFITLVYISMGLCLLWLFLQALKKLGRAERFHEKILKLLKGIAIIFIANDCVKIIDYFILGGIMQQHFPDMHFQLKTTIGSGFVTGLIVWAVAAIYAKGIALQEEAELTI